MVNDITTMQYMRILRPTLCRITTAVNSTHSFNQIFIPATSSINFAKGGNVYGRSQDRRRRPKMITGLKPLNFDYSEDLVKQEPLDRNEIVFKYRGIPEVDELPDHVKKLFTLGFATSQEKLEHRSALLLEKMTDLLGPGPCLEKEVCYLTVKIRNLIPYLIKDRRQKKHKSYLVERIARRQKLLRGLRRMDYDRFIWLLKELNVTCKPLDPYRYFVYTKRPRKARLRREAREATLALKKKKLEEIQTELEREKEKFHEMKGKILAEIDKDIKEFKLDKEEILMTFKNRLIEQQKQKIEEKKKLTRVQRTIIEMRLKKERESRVF